MILVAGAGPGGLTAALALQRAGFDVQCWERAAELRTVGAGISLQINAMRVMAALAVADDLCARGAVLGSAEISDHRDRTIQIMPFDRLMKEYGAPGIGIHRGELSRTLAEHLPAGTIVLGRAVAE